QDSWLQTSTAAAPASRACAHKLQSVLVRRFSAAILLVLLVSSSGCTGIRSYFYQNCKVGPGYHEPPAAVAPHWIDANDKRVNSNCEDICQWWKVFKDPALDALICTAYHQNLTLREAGYRILQARAQLGIARGEFFPQTQNLTGSYTRFARSKETALARAGATGGGSFGPRFFDQWDYGFNL